MQARHMSQATVHELQQGGEASLYLDFKLKNKLRLIIFFLKARICAILITERLLIYHRYVGERN